MGSELIISIPLEQTWLWGTGGTRFEAREQRTGAGLGAEDGAKAEQGVGVRDKAGLFL